MSEQTAQAPANLPEGVTQEMFNQGRQIFTGQGGCHACHGPQAKGTQLAPDLTDDVWLNVSGRNYDEIVALINSGVPQPHEHPGPMPPMGGANLTPEQVNAVAAYIVGLGQG
jgi:mono/diheme cytochrome c family protein